MGKDQELLEAARCGQVAIIEKIFCPPKSKWSNPLTLPLAQLTHLANATLRKNVNPNCQDGNGETPLHLAALNGHIDVVAALLKQQASANIADSRGCFPLHLAAWRGDAEMCRILLTHGPSISIVDQVNLEGETALHSAAQYGHTEVISILLENRADPRVMNKKKERALDLAIRYGRLGAVQLLLRCAGESATVRTGDFSPLHLAAKHGHKNVIEALLDAGFDVNYRIESGSALHEAVSYGRLDIVKLLLERDIDIHARSVTDQTALDLLAEQDTQISRDIHLVISRHIKSVDGKRSTTSLEVENEYANVPMLRAENGNVNSTDKHRERIVSESDSVFEDGSSAGNGNISATVEEEEGVLLYDLLPRTRPVLSEADDEEVTPCIKAVLKNSRPITCIDAPKKPPRKKTQLELNDGSSSVQRENVVSCLVSVVVTDYSHESLPAADILISDKLPVASASVTSKSMNTDVGGSESTSETMATVSCGRNISQTSVYTEESPLERCRKVNHTVKTEQPSKSTEDLRYDNVSAQPSREESAQLLKITDGSTQSSISDITSDIISDVISDGFTRPSVNREVDSLGSVSCIKTQQQVNNFKKFNGLRQGSIQRGQRQTNSLLLKGNFQTNIASSNPSKRMSVPNKISVQPVEEYSLKSCEQIGRTSPSIETIVLISSIAENGKESIKRHVSVRKASATQGDNQEDSTQSPTTNNLCKQVLGVIESRHFQVKYMGSTPVISIDGSESTMETICKLKKSASTVPSITLSISYQGVEFIEKESQRVICMHDIGNIFSANQDRESLDHFAYITSVADTSTSTRHFCHVFHAATAEQVREIMLALGQAFDLAYQISQQENKKQESAS